MDISQWVNQRVHKYYWEDDINCATATLKILAELTKIEIAPQVIDAALGLHGAGGFGAQCGLVEGTLVFIGIAGREKGIADADIRNACYCFAGAFQQCFGSLSCSQLRPKGTGEHLCEELTKRAVKFSVDYVVNHMGVLPHNSFNCKAHGSIVGY